jgi:rhodanese-related sulfurtransferase
MREMSPSECKRFLEQTRESPLLLDVREPWEYQIVHLEGSRLIPMREIPDRLKELDPHRQTLVICHHAIRSRQIAWFLEGRGFTAVINLRGGLDAWARDIDPDMRAY